jgi:transcriptional regulator with XRE-family HTH domain
MSEPAVNYQELPVSIASRLRAAREAAGLSRPQLGERTGIPHRQIEKYEYATAEPPLSRLKLICRTLGISWEDIWKEIDDGASDNMNDGTPEQVKQDPVMEARALLRQAADRLGMSVVDESNGPAASGPAVKVDADQDLSATGVLAELAGFTEGVPHEKNADQLTRRIDQALEELKAETPEALIDAATERGVSITKDQQARVTGEDAFSDKDEARKRLRQLLVVHAVYGIDPRQLTLNAVKKLNERLGKTLPDTAIDAPTDVGVVPHGRQIGELLDSDDAVRTRMALDLLPHLLTAAKAGNAPKLGNNKSYPHVKDGQG